MNRQTARSTRLSLMMTAIALSTMVLVACGGGAGEDGGSTSVTTGTISGTATKGPVSGATIRAYAIDQGVKGRQLGSAQTDSSGNFTMRVDVYSGPIMLQLHGGTYADEATGTRMNMLDTEMSCAVPSINVTAGSTVTGVQITPLTSMAHAWAEHMSGGLSTTNITTANMRIGTAYLGAGIDIVMTHPIDPTKVGSANGASIDARNYGMILAAMSQQAQRLGMTATSATLVTALHEDAADGVMNGMMDGTPVTMKGMNGMANGPHMTAATGSGDLATAMATFVHGPMNRSGVTGANEMQELIEQLHHLHDSGGHL